MSTPQKLTFVFFGGEPLGAPTLATLIEAGLVPTLVVCNPDRLAGRGKQLTPPPVKILAEQHGIPVWQPEDITNRDSVVHSNGLLAEADLFVVVAYNKILPEWLIELPKYKTINVHPSLLPKLRGASPIRSAILRDEPEHVGVSIMQMDSQMDHGPLLAQEQHHIDLATWPLSGPVLDEQLIQQGANLLAKTLPRYIANKCDLRAQNHEDATYCSKLTKDMAELDIDPYDLPRGDVAKRAYDTIQAFTGIGDAWFMHDGIRYKIKTAHLEGERLMIDTVVPQNRGLSTFSALF